MAVEVEKLEVQLNSTIQKVLQEAPLSVVESAIKSLREAIFENRVENPSGFFYRAVTAAWRPNEAFDQKAEQEMFNEWWKLAQPLGLVSAATQIEGIQHVLDSDNNWVPFTEILKRHPLKNL